MKRLGGQTTTYQMTDYLLRTATLVGPLFVAIYGIFLALGFLQPVIGYSHQMFTFATIGLLASSCIRYIFWRNTSRPLEILYVAFSHLCLALFLIFVSGFSTPPVMVWLFLILSAHYYLDGKGVWSSIISLLMVAFFASYADGRVIYVLLIENLSYALILAVSGNVISTIWSAERQQQIVLAETEVKEAFEKSQLTTLLNSVNEAIISINVRGIIQVYNAAALNLLDTNASLAGKHIDDALHIYHQDTQVSLYDEVSKTTKNIARDDLEHQYRTGERIALSLSSSPVRASGVRSKGRVNGYILVLRDITRAKSLDEERDEFISVVSHELRTPLTIAEGRLSNAQVLFDRGMSQSQIKEMIHSAHEQILYLSGMVNDLATLSRAESGIGNTPETIDVRHFIHQLYDEYAPKAQAKGLRCDLDIAPQLGTVRVSELYLEEILQNFLTNAIKYTAEGSIKLQAKVVGQKIRFAVSDTGIGIGKTDQQKIFKKFYRSEDYRTRETAGSGLGLYVVKKLAHKIGTTVHLKSRLNHGSEFWFELPRE